MKRSRRRARRHEDCSFLFKYTWFLRLLMKTVSIFLLATLLAPALSQDPKEPARYSGPKDKLHIYILAGQSNMSGRAKVEEEDRQIPKNLILLDSKGKWVQATHPFIQHTN